MMERGASAGVFIGKTRDALGASSDWYEGDSEHGPWVATTHEMRDLAIRWVVARRRLRDLSSASIDAGAMAEKAQRIKTALQNVTTVRRNLTQATNALDDMQKEIAAALGELEQAIQQGLQGNTVA